MKENASISSNSVAVPAGSGLSGQLEMAELYIHVWSSVCSYGPLAFKVGPAILSKKILTSNFLLHLSFES